MTIAVTGASGFIGRALAAELNKENIPVKPLSRETGVDYASPEAYAGCTAVVHLAARVHHVREAKEGRRYAYQAANMKLPVEVMRAAHLAGVRHFVFLSSLGAAEFEKRLAAEGANIDRLAVELPYQWSKWAGEKHLIAYAKEFGMKLCILRPPLVYGLGAPGNFRRLVWALKVGLPLPFGIMTAPRSYIYLENLVSALVRVVQQQTHSFVPMGVADATPVKTTDLIRNVADVLGVKARLLVLPARAVEFLCKALGFRRLWQSLSQPLVIDNTAFTALTQWQPPYDLVTGLNRTFAGERFEIKKE